MDLLDLRRAVHEEMVLLRERTPGVTGSAACTVDGMPVAADLTDAAEQTSAISAAVLAMARRMTGLAGLGGLEETLISGTDGFAACYAAGPTLILTVVAGPGCNLGLLRIEGRKTAAKLAALAEQPPASR